VALPSTPGTNLAEPAGISPSKRRYLADTQDVEVVKKIKQNEVELRDRNTVLRGTKANNFSAIRTAYTEKLKKLRDIKPGAPIPSVAPSSDPKAAIKKSRTFIMRVGSFVSKYVSFRNDVPHYHDLLITHCPHHDAQCQTVPCRIHLRTLSRSPRSRSCRRKHTSGRPNSNIPQTHAHRPIRSGNRDASKVFHNRFRRGSR